MYKYTIHICTKTSLNVSLTCSWGFLHPSGLPQNIATIKTFFFYTNYHKLVHNGEHDNINREGNKEVRNREKQNGSAVKYASKSVIAPAAVLDHTAYFSGSVAIKKAFEC